MAGRPGNSRMMYTLHALERAREYHGFDVGQVTLIAEMLDTGRWPLGNKARDGAYRCPGIFKGVKCRPLWNPEQRCIITFKPVNPEGFRMSQHTSGRRGEATR